MTFLPSVGAVSGQPVPCPFQGPYTFSYTKESAESCKDPQSEIQACADKSRFIFNYKRCKRLPHTEDIREYRIKRLIVFVASDSKL